MRRTVRALVTLGAALALGASSLSFAQAASAADQGPSIVSDQADYAPGSDVTLTGAGWTGGDNVHLVVDDVQGQTWQWQGDATASDSGGFDVRFTLPDWFVADYSVLADNGNGTTATTAFTDSNVQVGAVNDSSNPIVANVVWTKFRKDTSCSGTTTSTGNVNTVTNGNGFTGTTGVGSTTALSVQAATPVVYGGREYHFVNWTGPVNGSAPFLCVAGNADNGKINELAHYTDVGPATKTSQTITFNALGDKTYGDPDFNVSATASSGLTVTFSASGQCTVTGTLVHLTGAGDCTITADQAGNATYLPAPSVPRFFTINSNATTVTVTCPTSVTYTGGALEPCTASVTGTNLNQALTVSYLNNTNVGTATASASYAGDASHAPSSNSATFAITQASSTTTVTCPASVTYTGSALTPCTASVTGAGLTTLTPTPSYSNNTDAGTATASYSYVGDANHTGSSDSKNFTIGAAGTTTTVTCPSSATYTGSALTPCSATVTGANLSLTPTPSYSNNTGVGTATASYTYAGDGNHSGSSDSKTFSITAATSSVTITCPGSVTYTGAALTPCTAKATGAGMSDVPLTVTYGANTAAGTASADASWAGDANHSGSSNSTTFTIDKAISTVTLVCPSSDTYTGAAIEPCSATVAGANLSGSVPVTYSNNTDAGSATASATYAGDDNHYGDSDSGGFTIDPAASTVTVTCPTSVVYDGSAQSPCTAKATGVGMADVTGLTVTYSADHTDVGTVTASASWSGDANHTGNTGSSSFDITPAPSTTVVTCPVSVTYDGSAQTPCSVTVTGANLSLTPTPDYSDNVNAGQATASYSYAGDANHSSSGDTKHFTIDKAGSTTVVSCPATNPVYTGSAIEPCSASVTGAGDLDESLTVVYSNNTNAGTANASASYDGDLNHDGSSDSKNFTIDRAGSTTTVTCPSTHPVYTGSAITPCTASATGAGLTSPVSVTPVNYTTNTNAGSAGASATWAGDANHNGSTGYGSFVIDKAGSTTSLSCPSSVGYTGSARTPCTASATGAGIASPVTVTPTYADNTNAGTAHAYATWAGDGNHESSSDSTTFTISQASSVVTVTCTAATFTYTGSPISPCSAKATGAGMSDVTGLTVTYSADHTNVGNVTASASWAGDANHTGNSGSSSFDITKANPTCTVNGYSVTFDGSSHTATGSCRGVQNEVLSSLNLSGTSHTNANTYSDSWTFTSSSTNYNDASGSVTDVIGTATASLLYTGTEYVTQGTNAVLSASISSSTTACLSGQTLSFTLTPMFAGGTGLSTTSVTGSTGQASKTVATSALQTGLYEITVSLVSTNCSASDALDSLTVVGPGDTADGGGWYTLDSTSTGSGRVNFGFTVQKVPNTTNGYKGQLLLQNNGKWRLKATLDCTGCYGKSTATPPVGSVTGSGKLYKWDSTLNGGLGDWALVNSAAPFTINFTDASQGGGKKSSDAFAIAIDYTTRSGDAPLPNSKLITLKGGDVKLT